MLLRQPWALRLVIELVPQLHHERIWSPRGLREHEQYPLEKAPVHAAATVDGRVDGCVDGRTDTKVFKVFKMFRVFEGFYRF